MGSLSSVSHCIKSMLPKGGGQSQEPLKANLLVRNTAHNVGLQSPCEVEGSLVGLSPLPVEHHTVSMQMVPELK